jgi:hypothetical protein
MLKLFAILISLLSIVLNVQGQQLKLKSRKSTAVGGKTFALRISDSLLTLQQRENAIFKEIKKGNVPNFLRKPTRITTTNVEINASIEFDVLPDYFAIGSDSDFFYVPMTPILAQRVAKLIDCSLPTKKMVDLIYQNASIKLAPKPILPTKAMTTVPVFIAHTDSILMQLSSYWIQHQNSALTAGNKKDVILSNKIYGEKTARVVIYGWHQLNGQAIQPVYNKHTHLWVNYSHGIRFILNEVVSNRNGKMHRTTLRKALSNPKKSILWSDEGLIKKPYYPITKY